MTYYICERCHKKRKKSIEHKKLGIKICATCKRRLKEGGFKIPKKPAARRPKNPIPPAPSRGIDSGRECGCPFPKDYPNIDIHIKTCKYRRRTKEPSVGQKEEIPKVYPSGRKLSRSDATGLVTPTHQTFFSHEYTHLLIHQNNVWLAMAKRFDAKHNKG